LRPHAGVSSCVRGRGPSPACSDAPKTYGEDPFPK
jgi:hypothetical protein